MHLHKRHLGLNSHQKSSSLTQPLEGTVRACVFFNTPVYSCISAHAQTVDLGSVAPEQGQIGPVPGPLTSDLWYLCVN